MASSILGSPQIVKRLDGSTYDLPDPFLSTVIDFTRRALDQLARALQVVVVHTKQLGGVNHNTFFKGENGEFVSPSRHHSGHDVYHLLNNLKDLAKVYSDVLNVDIGDLKGTVEYLLQTIRNHIAHQAYLGDKINDNIGTSPHCSLRKYSTVQECLDKCIKLLGWFIKAPSYKDVRKKVQHIQANLTNMKGVVTDHQRHRKEMEKAEKQALDTKRAKLILHKLLRDLKAEEDAAGEKKRPVTHTVNMILAPRFPMDDCEIEMPDEVPESPACVLF